MRSEKAARKQLRNFALKATCLSTGIVLLLVSCSGGEKNQSSMVQSGITCPPLSAASVDGEEFSDGQISWKLPTGFFPLSVEPEFFRTRVQLRDEHRQLLVINEHWGESSFSENEGDWRLCITEIDWTDVILMERIDAPGVEMIAWFLTRSGVLQPLIHLRSDIKGDRDYFLQILASVKFEKSFPTADP